MIDIEKFESLPPEEQTKVFRESPIKEKGELLIHAHQPHELARALSQEELYLISREMDQEERSEILRYASLPQLFFISDLDCWKKDRISARGFLTWLETLKFADEHRLLTWLLEMDYETVVAGLKKLIRVMKPEREYAADELLGDTPYFTLDEMYFIFVTEENMEMVRRAIEILYENHRGKYVAYLEGIMGEVEDELEEEAYRLRDLRMTERGFPDTESAHRIYRPMTPKEFAEFPSKREEQKNFQQRSAPLPDYLTLWNLERLFLDDVLLALKEEPPHVQEGIQEEMVWLANKVISCDGIDFSSEERVRAGVERVRAYLNLGIELLAGRDVHKAKEYLKDRWLETIFRLAATQTINLRDRAATLARLHFHSRQQDFAEFLHVPYQFIFKGLFQTVPLYCDLGDGKKAESYRNFKILEDIHQTEIAVSQVEKMMMNAKEGKSNTAKAARVNRKAVRRVKK